MSKYYKNFILCGDADYHCILCEETFQDVSDVEKHIRWEMHRKELKIQVYLQEFKKDLIYKVKDSYYCQVCNILLKNMADTKQHITEERHKTYKVSPDGLPLRAMGIYDSGYVIINKYIISNRQWHSIIDKRCEICDEVADDYKEHLQKREHVLNLIKSECKYEDTAKFYRKLGEDKFQCFACKTTFPIKIFEEHWSENQHSDNVTDIENLGTNPKLSAHEIRVMKQAKLMDTQAEFFDIDMENKEATCKQCGLTFKFHFRTLIEHRKGHANSIGVTNIGKKILGAKQKKQKSVCSEENKVVNREIRDAGKRRAELAELGRQNYIKLNAGGSKGYCTLCDKYISAHRKVFKEHIEGTFHMNYLEHKGLQPTQNHDLRPYGVQTITTMIKNMLYIPEMKTFWVNIDYTVKFDSFLLMKFVEHGPHLNKFLCFACNAYYPFDDQTHCKSDQHKNNFMDIKCVTFPDEFIREVRPNLYHCGFCNRTFPFWEKLWEHLKSPGHNMMKRDKDIASFLSACCSRSNNFIEIKSDTNADFFYQQLISAAFG